LGSIEPADVAFPSFCWRLGSAPDCNTLNIFDIQVNATNWTQQNVNTYVATVAFDNPAPGSWFFEFVNPLTTTGFTMSVNTNVSACANGQLGVNCSQTARPLTNNSAIGPWSNAVPYDYYSVANNTLNVGVGTKNLKIMAPGLLTSTLNWPSNTSNQLAAFNNTVNFISAYAPSPVTPVTWYIAVAVNPNTPYYIWANEPCANMCMTPGKGNTTHGNCTVSTGKCSCDKHYGGLWCYHTGLATVWIVLIVIGCAILLAIAIGVPVALYLRSRQRARYERV